MSFLKIRGLAKEFTKNDGKLLRVLDGINLDVRKGEFVTIFGPNGCGKTTLLKILSGFELKTGGQAIIGKIPAEKSRSYLVFQNPDESLFNWMDVRQNIEIALNSSNTCNKESIDNLLGTIQVGGKTLLDFSQYYPYQLSGGLKQLTVIARAIAFSPNLLLLDEPFSSLDYKTSMEMEDALLKIWKSTRQTVLFVSHNIEEAVYLADRVVVLSNQPTKVRKIIDVNLKRPRTQEMKTSPCFQKIKKEVLDSFW